MLIPNDPGYADANAYEFELLCADHGRVDLPDDSHLVGPYWMAPARLPIDHRVYVNGHGCKLRAVGTEPLVDLIAPLDDLVTMPHTITGLEVVGDNLRSPGAAIRASTRWELRSVHVKRMGHGMRLVQDHVSIYNIDAGNCDAGIYIGPLPEGVHGGDHMIIAGNIGGCGFGVQADPTAKLDGWAVFNLHVSSCWFAFYRDPVDVGDAFMSNGIFVGVGAEFMGNGYVCALGTEGSIIDSIFEGCDGSLSTNPDSINSDLPVGDIVVTNQANLTLINDEWGFDG